jgi:hypothetical protein
VNRWFVADVMTSRITRVQDISFIGDVRGAGRNFDAVALYSLRKEELYSEPQ